jgi:predicted enzyme related to lactoylglutathione lyase
MTTVQAYSVILLRVADVAGEARWYREAFGLEPRREEAGRLVTFRVPNGPELELAAGGRPLPPVTDRIDVPCIPIFHVDDVAGALAAAVAAGGRVVNQPFTLATGSTLAYVASPEGHVVGLSSLNQSASS